MMKSEELKSRFINVLNEFSGSESFNVNNLDLNLLDDGYVDSVEFLNLLMRLEEEFGVEMDLSNLKGPNPDNLGYLFNLITSEQS